MSFMDVAFYIFEIIWEVKYSVEVPVLFMELLLYTVDGVSELNGMKIACSC